MKLNEMKPSKKSAEFHNVKANTSTQNLPILVFLNQLGNLLEQYIILLLSIELRCINSVSNNVRLNLLSEGSAYESVS